MGGIRVSKDIGIQDCLGVLGISLTDLCLSFPIQTHLAG